MKGRINMLNRIIVAVTVCLFFFSPARAGAYNLYFGNIHSHTSFSDGQGTPDEAFEMARDVAHLDFWVLSDHAEQLGCVQNVPPGTTCLKEWDVTHNSARAHTENGKFVAAAAFEWGAGLSHGHMNALNTKDFPEYGESYSLKKFYRWIYTRPDALTGFNHPSDCAPGCFVFNNMEYVPQIASQTFYIALNNPEDFKYFYMALDNGWRIGPVGEQDNHSKNWGVDPSGNLMGVYADDLTCAGLIDAFVNRRFYTTNDRALRLWFAGDGQPMGSRIKAGAVEFTIDAAHEKGTKIISVKLVTNGGRILKEWKPDEDEFHEVFKLTPPVDSDGVRWYLVIAEVGEWKHAVSAPIWVEK